MAGSFSPVPGVTYPDPITWGSGEFITAPRLRGDIYNLASIYMGARPMLICYNNTNPVPVAGSDTYIGIGSVTPLNTWNVNLTPTGFSPAAYLIPFAGYWLLQSQVTFTVGSGGAGYKYGAGFTPAANAVIVGNIDGGALPASSTSGSIVGVSNCDLYQFNYNEEATDADFVQTYVYTDNPSVGSVRNAFYMFEWVGLPTSGLTDYPGPYGTVATPVAAASFPSGPGTTVTGSVAQGATSITVADATGMIAGGTLGLDYINGQLYQPYAETVGIASVAGTTIGITATQFAHSSGAPVAVPVGSVFLNQQVRDQVNFLAYPPLLKAAPTTSQSLASGAFPTGTQITNLTASIDNFSGFASNEYTIPAAGTYLVYGQVYYAGTGSGSFTFSAGIQQNSGTVQWGVRARSNTTSAERFGATVRRVLRCSAGDTIKLYGFQDSGSAMSTVTNSSSNSRLICVFRTF